MRRVLGTVQFLWVLGQATVDGLTRWLCAFTRHHRTMSDVLRAERYLLTQELLRVSCAVTPTADPSPLRLGAALPVRSRALRPPPTPCRVERCTGAYWTSCM